MAFGEGAFQLLDVRRQDRLGYRCDTGAGTLVFNGGTDAVIVPYDELMWELQLRMMTDLKTPPALNTLGAMDLQQKLELIGSLYHSNHPSLMGFHRSHKLCHLLTLRKCNPVAVHLCSSSVWSDCSIRCNVTYCSAIDSCKFQRPGFFLPAP